MKTITEIQILKDNLISNIDIFKSKFRNGKIVAMVKGNAYGHGVKEVVEVLEGKVEYFGVDDIDELKEIRKYTNMPVIAFGYVSEDQLEEFVELNATLGIYDINIARKLNELGGGTVHVKIDALLGRQGILLDQVEEFFSSLQELENINVEAIYTHFSNIEDTDDLSHAQKQYEMLMEVKDIAVKYYPSIYHHISATSGFLTDMENNWGGEILRLGIGLYGLWPSNSLKERLQDDVGIKPVMRWVTHVAQVKTIPANFPIGYGCTFITNKETKIAVIPQGYSDGYDRGLSNKGEVLIQGKRCKVLGRIAMNMFVVDITGLDVTTGDEVVILGRQKEEEITAEEIADKIDTINYEIVTRVWPKLKRVIL
jgi:alanine racemase